MRTILMLSGLMTSAVLVLSACGESEPEIACCAIEPKAKCEGDLLGAGVTREELSVLMGSAEWICPSGTLSEARIKLRQSGRRPSPARRRVAQRVCVRWIAASVRPDRERMRRPCHQAWICKLPQHAPLVWPRGDWPSRRCGWCWERRKRCARKMASTSGGFVR